MSKRIVFLRSAASALALLTAAAGLAGCQSHDRLITYATWKQQEPLPKPQLQVTEVQHVVAFAPKALEMSDVEREAVAMFVQANRLQAGSHVGIASAAITPAQVARSQNRIAAVRSELSRYGITSTVLPGKAGRPEATGDEVVVLAQAVAVTAPQCPGYNAPTDLDHEYRPVGPTGCANAINLGLMVANPGDLAQGQALAAADGTAAVLAIERYRGVQVQGWVYPFPPDDPAHVAPWGQATH